MGISSRNIEKLEITMNLLEAKLSSIPGLEGTSFRRGINVTCYSSLGGAPPVSADVGGAEVGGGAPPPPPPPMPNGTSSSAQDDGDDSVSIYHPNAH